MARKNEPSIVNVFSWLSNTIDARELKLGDIGLLTHIVKNLNRNFWKPLKMSTYKIAKSSGSDDRTIRGALKRLAEKHILLAKNGDTFEVIKAPSEFFAAKKMKQSDDDNYFSLIQKEGEFFIGIDTRKISVSNLDDAEQKSGSNNAGNGSNNAEHAEQGKTLADLL